MDITHISSILSAVLIIVAVAAAAFGALNREQLKTVRDSNADLTARVKILEDAETRHVGEIATLQAEKKTLQSIVTGEAHLVAINGAIDDHHKAATKQWDDINKTLAQIVRALERLNR